MPVGVESRRAGTGIEGLDDILHGGLPAGHLYLIEGAPGAGKTTLALQFLLAGRDGGERGLYITLSETERELRAVAASHGWTLQGIEIQEPIVGETFGGGEDNTLFQSSEVELAETTRAILSEIERVEPARVVIDSLSEIRLLSANPVRFRHQVTALKAYLARRGCTSLLLDDNTEGGDAHLQSVVNGVIRLDQEEPLYGPVRRRLAVQKVRAVSYRGGKHDFRMATGGIRVFPRLVAAEHGADFPPESVSSGVPELDRLLGGGIERGTATLVLGPAGTGKSAIVSQYVAAAARRGERSAMFIFDEGLETLFRRSEALGQPLRRDVESGRTMIQQIDPAEVSPGEFTQLVRTAVEREGARLVVVDTLNGYVHAMPEEHSLTIHLHELHSYLRLKGVVALSTLAQHGLMTGSVESPIDLSYLTDTVLMLRYFEAEGRIRKAVSVIKKRGGAHETALRELTMDSGSLQVGEPLVRFRGILTGSPVYVGPPDPLLPERT